MWWPACNIATTVSNLFKVVFLSMGNAVAIMVGQALGANDIERRKLHVAADDAVCRFQLDYGHASGAFCARYSKHL